MAGSYQHVRADDGTFRFDPIENLRDAYEACEEMFYLIDRLTNGGDMARIQPLLDEYYRGCRGEGISPEARAAWERLHASELAQQRMASQREWQSRWSQSP